MISLSVLKQSIWQTAAIFVASIIVALGVNALRSGGIPLVRDYSTGTRMIDRSGARMDISLDDAARAFENGSAFFLDARSPSEYALGHIKGARLVPFEDLDEYVIEATADIPSDALIITYCDGEACMLSHDLALYLKDFGFERVYVLINGWTLWMDKGLPVEQGPAPTQNGGQG